MGLLKRLRIHRSVEAFQNDTRMWFCQWIKSRCIDHGYHQEVNINHLLYVQSKSWAWRGNLNRVGKYASAVGFLEPEVYRHRVGLSRPVPWWQVVLLPLVRDYKKIDKTDAFQKLNCIVVLYNCTHAKEDVGYFMCFMCNTQNNMKHQDSRFKLLLLYC